MPLALFLVIIFSASICLFLWYKFVVVPIGIVEVSVLRLSILQSCHLAPYGLSNDGFVCEKQLLIPQYHSIILPLVVIEYCPLSSYVLRGSLLQDEYY